MGFGLPFAAAAPVGVINLALTRGTTCKFELALPKLDRRATHSDPDRRRECAIKGVDAR